MTNKKQHNHFILGLVNEIKHIKKAYKYLTYESGMKMLSNCNIQFTRADTLNDSIDLTSTKFNLDHIRNVAEKIKANPEEWVKRVTIHHQDINKLGICSLGTSQTNFDLWERYAMTDGKIDGICIEINLRATINCLLKRGFKTPALKVRYLNETEGSIPYNLYTGNETERYTAEYLLFATKNKSKWECEEEVRLLLPEILTEEYKRISIFKSCITNISFGCHATDIQKESIAKIIKEQNYKIKLV